MKQKNKRHILMFFVVFLLSFVMLLIIGKFIGLDPKQPSYPIQWTDLFTIHLHYIIKISLIVAIIAAIFGEKFKNR